MEGKRNTQLHSWRRRSSDDEWWWWWGGGEGGGGGGDCDRTDFGRKKQKKSE